jgi:hypothetical protein
MRLYLFATLSIDEAALLADCLAGVAPGLAELRRKLIPTTVPTLPSTALVLHDEHAAHRVVLLLDDSVRKGDALAQLRQHTYEEYGQELTDVPLTAAQSVDALDRIVREANANESDADDGL